MTQLDKVPIGNRTIRFQDCDPFGHLNNSKYIDYMINVREDHLMNDYGLNVFAMAQVDKRAWLVGHNEIAYLKPASVMEEVVIQTALIDFTDRYVKAEMVMMDKSKSHVKAVLWTKFYHFDFKMGQGVQHHDELMILFDELKIDVELDSVEQRARFLARGLKESTAA